MSKLSYDDWANNSETVLNIAHAIHDESAPSCAGIVYPDDSWIVDRGFFARQGTRYWSIVGQFDWETDNLAQIEKWLWDNHSSDNCI